jgi:glycosyltransferase involved in cell wall biosynthesis
MNLQNLRKIFKLITLLQRRETTYQELVEYIYWETPPERHNFLGELKLNKAIAETIISSSYNNTFNFKERPRRNARIAFIITRPFHYYIYKNIYAHLPEAEYVIDFAGMKAEHENSHAELRRLTAFLQEEGVHYRIYDLSRVLPENFFKQYTILVCHYPLYVLELPCNKDKKKVRVMYGHAKDLYNFGSWLHQFDLALNFGPYSNRMIGAFTRAEIMGNPRFDDWFSGKITENTVAYLRKRLDPNKKTLLYMPTHSELSSLEFAATAIAQLTGSYNLIIKYHPLSLTAETERLETFRRTIAKYDPNAKPIWVDDTIDNQHLLFVADAVISDNSGAVFDALLVDKPLILLDCLPENFLEKENWHIKKVSRNAWLRPYLYDGSIDQRIKREPELQIGEVVKKADQLPSAVAAALNSEKKFDAARKKLRRELFSFNDGNCGKRAARLIQDLEKEPPKKESFIKLSLCAEKEWSIQSGKGRYRELWRALSHYVNPVPYFESKMGEEEILFSVIIPTYNSAGRITEALTSLARQEGIDPARYEIIVIDDGSEDSTRDEVSGFIKQHPDRMIVYAKCKENRGPSYARNIGILLARGTYVAFTDDDCVVSSDWLSKFHLAFRENPEIAGVGGWYRPAGGTVFDRFIFFYDYPRILYDFKSAAPGGNLCGNTANVCYRRSSLKTAGGFNHFFLHPSLDDWELKTRMHRHRFALLYHEHMVEHLKRHNLRSFIRYAMVRGWGRFLTHKIHHMESTFYNVTLLSMAARFIIESQKIFSGAQGMASISAREKILFFFADIIFNIATLFGKYWIPIEILSKHKRA